MQEVLLGHQSNTSPLSALRPGESATIESLGGDLGLMRRLKALGLGQGQRIHLLRRAWMAGPLHVRVGMTELMLRRVDANHIRIAPRTTPQAA